MGVNQRARKAPWQLFSVFTLAILMIGCATQSGPPLSSLATLGGLPKGMAQIVVVRQEPHPAWPGATRRDFTPHQDGRIISGRA